MFRFYLKSAEYDIRNVLNQILYYFRKIPLLKWLAPSSSYRFHRTKKTLSAIAPFALIIWGILKSLFSFGIIAAISALVFSIVNLFTNYTFSQVYLLILVIIYCLDFSNFYLRDKKDKTLMYFDLFEINPKTMMLSNIFIDNFINNLSLLLGSLIVFKIAGISLKLAPLIAFYSYCLYIISNSLNTKLSDKKLIGVNSEIKHGLLMIGLMLVFLVLFFIFNFNIEAYISNSYVFILVLVATLLSSIYLVRFSNYTAILIEYSNDYEGITGKNKNKEAIKKSIEIKSTDFEASKGFIREGLTGYNLLNEIFFQRHRRMILKPIKIKLIIQALPLLLVVIIPFLPFAFIKEDLPKDFGKVILEVLPTIVPFAAYLVFNNESITRTFFLNCDQALLQYGFYKRPKDLLKMFFLRLKKLLLWNSLALSTMFIFLIAMYIINKAPLLDCIIVGIQYMALWVFFSVHTLFVYYILQPYNDAQELKSPLYNVVNILLYYVCYFTMQLGLKGPLIAPIYIGASILYSIIALVCVYKFAPKTFKVRVRKG